MQDRVNPDIGALEPDKTNDQPWDNTDWAEVNKRVRNLRQRIYRATCEGQWNKVRSLKKLMMRSHANLLQSTRRVTQENAGKKTAGLDGQTALTAETRTRIVQEMQEYKPWQVKPTRRVYIPKANGKLRPLGIPTLKDRIAQAIIKNALEPSWEVRFEANSYGFRPGRSCHDAIEQCWFWLQGTQKHHWILDADIRGAFDNISHQYILAAIGQTPGRGWIKEWLKAGYVEAEILHATENGTPQGGVLSPLLANIALDGMEQWLTQWTKTRAYPVKSGKDKGRIITKHKPRYAYARYADDFIITAETREEIEAIIPHVKTWLAERGLELNMEKTQIRHITEGFNFLGFHIRRYNVKCLTKPQPEKVRAKLREIKEWLEKHPNVEPDAVIDVLNPILRGWANYYKHGVSKETFAALDHHLTKLLIKWAERRHPNKGPRWVIPRYFTTIKGNNWVFYAKTHDRREKPKTAYLYVVATTPITRHVKVRGTASPDDPTLAEYWAARRTKEGKTYFTKGSKLYHIAEQQQWKCTVCKTHLFNGERIHIHHEIWVKDGGTEEEGNLQLLHEVCHRTTLGNNPNKTTGA